MNEFDSLGEARLNAYINQEYDDAFSLAARQAIVASSAQQVGSATRDMAFAANRGGSIDVSENTTFAKEFEYETGMSFAVEPLVIIRNSMQILSREVRHLQAQERSEVEIYRVERELEASRGAKGEIHLRRGIDFEKNGQRAAAELAGIDAVNDLSRAVRHLPGRRLWTGKEMDDERKELELTDQFLINLLGSYAISKALYGSRSSGFTTGMQKVFYGMHTDSPRLPYSNPERTKKERRTDRLKDVAEGAGAMTVAAAAIFEKTRPLAIKIADELV